MVEDQTIRLYEDTQPSTINIDEGESYLDSALCGQDFYLLVEDETGTKQIRKYDLSEQIWENMENEELVQALKKRQVMDVWLQILWQKRYIQKAQESLSIVWKRMKPLMLLMEKY